MSTQGLLERPNGFYFQARIPKQYQAHYSQQILRERLPTQVRKEAIALVRKRWAELHEEFERIDSTDSKYKTSITKTEADFLINLAIHSRLSADDELRENGLDDDMYSMLGSFLEQADQNEKLAISRGNLTPEAIMIVSNWLGSHGYDIDENSKEFRDFAFKYLKAQVAATNAMKLRHQGIPSETPPPPKGLLPNMKEDKGWDSIDKLKEYWLSQPAKSSGIAKSRTAESEANTIIKKFKSMVGDLKPSEVTRHHIVELKDKMLEAGSSPATINKGRGILAAIFSFAEKNGKIDKNPFVGMEKLTVPNSEVEKPYTIS